MSYDIRNFFPARSKKPSKDKEDVFEDEEQSDGPILSDLIKKRAKDLAEWDQRLADLSAKQKERISTRVDEIRQLTHQALREEGEIVPTSGDPTEVDKDHQVEVVAYLTRWFVFMVNGIAYCVGKFGKSKKQAKESASYLSHSNRCRNHNKCLRKLGLPLMFQKAGDFASALNIKERGFARLLTMEHVIRAYREKPSPHFLSIISGSESELRDGLCSTIIQSDLIQSIRKALCSGCDLFVQQGGIAQEMIIIPLTALDSKTLADLKCLDNRVRTAAVTRILKASDEACKDPEIVKTMQSYLAALLYGNITDKADCKNECECTDVSLAIGFEELIKNFSL